MKEIYIDGRMLTEEDELSPVTYIPSHADGNPRHPDAEIGVLVHLKSASKDRVFVLYSKSRTVQSTNPDNLVWG